MIVKNRRVRLLHLAAVLVWLAGAAVGAAQDRTVEAILSEINSLEMPAYDVNRDTPNTNYVQELLGKRREITLRRSELIGELYRAYPLHPETANLLPERWDTMFSLLSDYDGVLAETQSLLKSHPDYPSERYAWQFRAMSAMMCYSRGSSYDAQKIVDPIEDYIKRYPDSSQGPSMLYEAASFHLRDREQSTALLRRIASNWPLSGAAREAKRKLRQVDEIDKPFELQFTDAITGSDVSIKSLRGKIVVIDFWASWSPQCDELAPRLKDLYEKWRPQGVEFIGVNLDPSPDQRGLDGLKGFLDRHGITWPQYYQGLGWQSEFSSSWGVDRLPCIFIVDHEGNLAATAVSNDELEDVVSDLVEKRDATGSAAADG